LCYEVLSLEVSELEKKHNELSLKQIAGKTQHIEINERTLEAYRAEYTKKGLAVTREEDYPQEDFYLVKKLKQFDALVDPSQGIRKVIESMVRQPVTIFNKTGKAEVKDALYYSGNYYGTDKRGNDIGAEFHEGSYRRPKLVFSYTDSANPYDPKTGERRGEYKQSGFAYEYYIFLSSDKKERRKQLEEIIQKATGTSIGNLENHHLHYRNPSPYNNRQGGHGGSFNWSQFCDLSIQELGECQNKNYYREQSTGVLKDKDGRRVKWDDNTGKMEAIK
jgi:hypothetical protein